MKKILCALIGWLAALVVHSQTIAVTMPNVANQNVGAQFNVAVQTATNILAASNVKAYQFSIALPTNCTFVSIVHQSGDLGFSWGTPTYNVSSGVLTIASAGSTNITGSGTFFRIRLQAAAAGTQGITFSPTNLCFFNQGSPGRTLTNGSVQVNTPPAVAASPGSQLLVIGEQVTCSATGGTAPYTYTLTTPSVGSMSAAVFTAGAQGSTRVRATDVNGNWGETGTFEVRSYEVSVGSDQGNALHPFSIPLTLNNPGNLGFSAGEFQVVFDNSVFNFTGITSTGTTLAGTSISSNVVGNNLFVSFGTQSTLNPASGAVLCRLNFVKDPSWSGGAFTSIALQSILFNESHNARMNAGTLLLDPPQTIALSPGVSLMKAGQTQQFAASGGTPPYVWSVSNPLAGSISSAGLFTATNGGQTTITVQDAAGNSATSAVLPVYDADLSLEPVSVLAGTVVHVPVVLGPSANNEPVLSYQLSVGYDATSLSFIGVEQTTTISQGWSTNWSTPSGQLIISAAGTQAGTPGGVLVFLKFQTLAPLSAGQSTGLYLNSALINEGDPIVVMANGAVTSTANDCGASGCMNSYACNYDANALCDNGTCAFNPALCSVQVRPKVILEGPYSAATGTMSDAIRSAGYLPLTEPYTALGYAHVSGGGGATTTAGVLATTGTNAIVDWVVVELRDATAPSTRLATRCALVQRDGDVVGMDGASAVSFPFPAGNYRLAIRHRNHLGAMTLNAIALSSIPSTVDFSSVATSVFGTNARKSITGAFPAQTLWAGDTNFDHGIQYTGAGNDRDLVLIRVGSTTPNNTVSGYHHEDVNMDASVKYTGANNDRDPILINVGSTTPNNVRVEQLP